MTCLIQSLCLTNGHAVGSSSGESVKAAVKAKSPGFSRGNVNMPDEEYGRGHGGT